jgi:oxygen-independent coproporphyrinogen-3 oxidase
MYWQREDYLGVGLGAASCMFRTRWQNVGTLADYVESLRQLHRPPVDEEELTVSQCMSEVMFMGLRQTAGVDVYPVIDRYRIDPLRFYDAELRPLYAAGLLEYVEDAHSLRLTEKGLMLANQVFLAFIKEDYEDIQYRRTDKFDVEL